MTIWIKNPNCAQCGHPLTKRDADAGRVCTPCVIGNRAAGSLYDNTKDADEGGAE